jgi:NADH-quinone oxidoreductase subunit L
MTVPLIVLAVGAVLVGAVQLPFGDSVKRLESWLEPVLVHGHEAPPAAELVGLAVAAVLLAVGGIYFAFRVYQQHKVDPASLEKPAFAHALYIDDAYGDVVGGPGEAAFQDIADFDSEIVDGAVNGVGRLTMWAARALRPLQSGLVRAYALAVAGGAVVLLVFVVMRMSI